MKVDLRSAGGRGRLPLSASWMPKAFYRRNLPHLQRDNRPHFLTFCTYHRWIFPACARQITLDCCVHEHASTIDLNVVVVMPDHVHLIFTPLVDRARCEVVSLARITKAIKGASAHLINRQLGRTGTVWQEESFDRVLRYSEKLDEKMEYVLNNSSRRVGSNGADVCLVVGRASEIARDPGEATTF
jgi:REP element-mobilizing transposase RayT